MGWRFRKSFSPLPGVRLTFSPNGISTSVGVGPCRFTVGPQGAAITSRIPGAGIAFRQTINGGSSKKTLSRISTQTPVLEEIKSSPSQEMTSSGLSEFRELLTRSYQERSVLLPELQKVSKKSIRLDRKCKSWSAGWLFRKLFQKKYLQIQKDLIEIKDYVEELHEQEKLSRLQTRIEISEQSAKSYSRFLGAFSDVMKCKGIWDVVTQRNVDRIKERTNVDQSVNLNPVVFDFKSCDLIESEWKVPHLSNSNGGDIYIYPGFFLVYNSINSFALVEMSNIKITVNKCSFTEERSVPSDAKIIGQTWKKVNKNGSPDRRFANNYQIPIVEYADLMLESSDGLCERYLFSNFDSIIQFDSALESFKKSLVDETGKYIVYCASCESANENNAISCTTCGHLLK